MERTIRAVAIISGILLLLAVGSLPYGYYQFLRLFIFLNGGFLAYEFNRLKRSNWLIIFVVASLLFNPIFPVYLDKDTWIVIDLIAAALFFYSSSQITAKKS